MARGTAIVILVLLLQPFQAHGADTDFDPVETTIGEVHESYASGRLTARQLTQMYLARIERFDRNGPKINSLISINPEALERAGQLDALFEETGEFVGPLHGIPLIVKDQIDVQGMPTTLGSVMLEDFYPDDDAFVVRKLRAAGAIILGKTTLGEWGGGDTYGSLFGATRNPYSLERTVGGSSGGTAAGIAANFAVVGVGQEGYASIRRPAAWTSLVGLRPSAGLVSRSGVYDGWPSEFGSLGPMTRTVRDAAILLNALVGYDPEDPLTARGVGNTAQDYTAFLDEAGLRQARIGVIREPLGYASEPDSEDFAAVDGVFDQAIEDLASAGADIVDPVSIPDIRRLLATRTVDPHSDDAFHHYFAGNSAAPFHSREEALQSPAIKRVSRFGLEMLRGYLLESSDISRLYQYRVARDALLTKLLKVMADYNLDAIVHKSVEHQPTLIRDGINPPFVRGKGALAINTFLVYVPTITVPAGFTEDCLPVGISFLGRPYSDGEMIRLAYSYEQATLHRRPPESTMAGGKTGSRALASAGCQTRRGRE